MQIVFQILLVIISVIAYLQKNKSNMMLWLTINNLVSVCMYFSFARIASAVICGVAMLRTFVYFIFAKKNIKPNIYILILFEIGFVVSSVLTWQDSLDFLPLFALMVVGYTSWQNNTVVLRAGYIVNRSLFFVYQMIIGAYISAASTSISLLSGVFAIIYYNLLKKYVSLFDVIKKRMGKKNKNAKEKLVFEEDKLAQQNDNGQK